MEGADSDSVTRSITRYILVITTGTITDGMILTTEVPGHGDMILSTPAGIHRYSLI